MNGEFYVVTAAGFYYLEYSANNCTADVIYILEKFLTAKEIKQIFKKFKTDKYFQFDDIKQANKCIEYLNCRMELILKMTEFDPWEQLENLIK